MTDEQIIAAAEEIAIITPKSWEEAPTHRIADIIRRHATAETMAMPKCLDCGGPTYIEESGLGTLFAVACSGLSDKCMRGAFRYSRDAAIAAYARLCVKDGKHDVERCHVCKAAVGELHAGHCSVSPGVMVATKPPEPKFDLPDCCLCGKPPKIEAGYVWCETSGCAVKQRGLVRSDWSRLHAPNRLTLPMKCMMPLALSPVEIGHGGTISAIFDNQCDARKHASEQEGRRVLDPIRVEVTVKP